jgi:DNA-binding Xre family transcriptional regulator
MKISPFRIEVILAEQGITKSTLALKCGISRQNISTIIRRGTCEPKTAGKLAMGLGISLSEIIEQEVS